MNAIGAFFFSCSVGRRRNKRDDDCANFRIFQSQKIDFISDPNDNLSPTRNRKFNK